jgi:hypothetical protein
MASAVSGNPAGTPSTTARSPLPWDSPAFKYLNITILTVNQEEAPKTLKFDGVDPKRGERL